MLRATSIVRKAAVKSSRVADTITLDHEGRTLHHGTLTGQSGLTFLLDLDKETALDDGDAVKLEDGRLVQIKAKPEHLLEVRAETPVRLLRIAWHMGSRHVLTEIIADTLYMAHDPKLIDSIKGLGGAASSVERPFRPEKAASHQCDHSHGAHTNEGHSHHHDEHAGHSHGAGCCGHNH